MGRVIASMRKSRKLSLKKLAEMVGISSKKLSELENGQYIARPDEIEKIALALGVAIDDLKYRADKYKI